VAIGAITEDSSGAIWVGTGSGDLWRFARGDFTQFTPPREWPTARFASLLADTNGIIWAGTLGNGLITFDNGQFARFRSQDGLPDDNVTQLLDDRRGSLWGSFKSGKLNSKPKILTKGSRSFAHRMDDRTGCQPLNAQAVSIPRAGVPTMVVFGSRL
jgi:ligand-binding sensor domain-containing protein